MKKTTMTFAAAALALGAALPAAAAVDAAKAEALAKQFNCLQCHSADKKTLGPAYKDVAQKYKGNKDAPANLVKVVMAGGKGVWGPIPMPPNDKVSDADLADLWAYLRSLKPVTKPNRAHELGVQYRWRGSVTAWKKLNFTPGTGAPVAESSPPVARGDYLVNALGHCGECHTPRDFLGGPRKDRSLAGGKGPNGKRIPNLTPTRLKSWSDADLKNFLMTGATPDGDAADEMMDEVVRNTTSKLTPQDLAAMIAYLRSLAPLPDEPRDK